MKRLIYYILAFSIFTISCKKEKPEPLAKEIDLLVKGTWYATKHEYFSTSKDTSWSYQDTFSKDSTTTFLLKKDRSFDASFPGYTKLVKGVWTLDNFLVFTIAIDRELHPSYHMYDRTYPKAVITRLTLDELIIEQKYSAYAGIPGNLHSVSIVSRNHYKHL